MKSKQNEYTPPNHVPEPDSVSAARDRLLRGERLPDENQQKRPYFCRNCGAGVQSALIPRGWYRLERSSGSPLERSQRLGLYCSLTCLAAQMDRLIGIEADLGDQFDTVSSAFRQRRTR